MSLAAQAQIAFTGGWYSENFDHPMLPMDDRDGYAHNTPVPGGFVNNAGSKLGWFAHTYQTPPKASSTEPLTTSDGDYELQSPQPNGLGLFSFGAIGSGERAFGMDAGISGVNVRFSLALQNTSGATINSLPIAFVGEQWNVHLGPNAKIEFGYQLVAGPAFTDHHEDAANKFTAVTALDFNTIHVGTALDPNPLDGNLAANRKAISGTLTFASGWQSGQYLWLSWYYQNQANAPGLAIDDLKVGTGTVPEPKQAAVLGSLALLGFAAVRRFRSA